MTVGSYVVPAADVVRSMLHLSGDSGVDFIVRKLRPPRAVAVGMALGVAGTVFQRLLANPLATPDIIGISSGASLAAIAGIALFTPPPGAFIDIQRRNGRPHPVT